MKKSVLIAGKQRRACKRQKTICRLIFWRRGWDSNPCAISRKLISSQPRYDHFDTSPYSIYKAETIKRRNYTI